MLVHRGQQGQRLGDGQQAGLVGGRQQGGGVGPGVGGCVHDTFDLQSLGRLEKQGELVVRHRDCAMVHVGHQGIQHLQLDIIENKDRVTTGVVLQDLLEVRTAG